MYRIKRIIIIPGCSYDDNCGSDVLCLLAATKHLLPCDNILSICQHVSSHTGNLSWHLLVSDEQFNVQSYYLLYLL